MNGAVSGLALLATGNPDYLPRVQELARIIALQARKPERRDDMVTWNWGHQNLVLCEYDQVTREQEVLPGLRGLIV